jgi:hypothetical protein
MQWQLMNTAVSHAETDGMITLAAPGRTDFFNDMVTGVKTGNAPFYYTLVSGDFLLRCEVRPDFRATYDAGALMVWESPERWVKLCFEKTDLGHTACVSVATDGTSDDANGEVIRGRTARLQVVRAGSVIFLYHGGAGRDWRMVRCLSLPLPTEVRAGIVAQSPLGEGCTVRFSGLETGPNPYKDLRRAQ